ncbi:hypothetical protein LJR237_004154 [Bosea sp. LjRoot237]
MVVDTVEMNGQQTSLIDYSARDFVPNPFALPRLVANENTHNRGVPDTISNKVLYTLAARELPFFPQRAVEEPWMSFGVSLSELEGLPDVIDPHHVVVME